MTWAEDWVRGQAWSRPFMLWLGVWNLCQVHQEETGGFMKSSGGTRLQFQESRPSYSWANEWTGSRVSQRAVKMLLQWYRLGHLFDAWICQHTEDEDPCPQEANSRRRRKAVANVTSKHRGWQCYKIGESSSVRGQTVWKGWGGIMAGCTVKKGEFSRQTSVRK